MDQKYSISSHMLKFVDNIFCSETMQAIIYRKPLLLLSILLALTSQPVLTASPGNEEFEDANITQLIAGLDSKKYEVRESCTNKLVEMGRVSLKPVAQEYFDANPEIAWRIKRILKKIATEAQEELTSLQAIGVLIALDQTLARQQWDSELNGLLTKWRENRSARAIDYLLKRGARNSPSGVQRRLFAGNFNMQQLSFGAPESTKKRTQKKKPKAPEAKPKVQTLLEIDELVEGDFEKVQDYVFRRLPAADVAEEQLVQPQIIINGRRVGIGRGATSTNWTFIEIGEGWTGDANDLKRLSEIHTLRALRFRHQNLTASELDLISSLEPLQHLGIVKSVFVGNNSVASLDLPPGLSSLELGDMNINEEVTDWLMTMTVANLTIEKCTLDPQAAKSFRELQQLVTLDLRRIRIDGKMFRSLAEISTLKRLNLSVCKFLGEDFRTFARIRPRIAVFNPVSFLGVQAQPTIGGAENWTCEIEMVVPESAADVAGVRAGDIIKAVNDDPVVTFQDLRMYISQHEVGEEMKLDIERDGEDIVLTAKLGSIENR